MESFTVSRETLTVHPVEPGTWQERMAVKWAELLRTATTVGESREVRTAALDRAIRLETILAEEGEFEQRVTR